MTCYVVFCNDSPAWVLPVGVPRSDAKKRLEELRAEAVRLGRCTEGALWHISEVPYGG